MKTNLKIFCGLSIFAIIAVTNTSHAATTSVVNNKTSQFNDVLSEMGANATDSSNAALAETIRRQRALLDAAGNTDAAGGTNITTANACDATLRKCMSEKCGTDFTKCASDSTTVWGNKMDACRRNTKCTGHEYTLLAPEILADRNAAIELSYYNSVVNCGNRYNNCVFGICGKSLENCLSKSAGDSAIAKCKSIADECREQDSGLAARVMGVFGDRRNIAATEAQRDEKRLYELRDLMRTQCTRFGAMFDERTLDCVYTVNFFAGTDNTLMASKKLYSGDTFQCTPDWFGVDITTYMENAARLTRSQTSASAAAMGAGFGTAASLWTSGAVTRAIDTQNAEKQAKEACTAVGGEWVSAGFNQGKTCDMTNAKENCTKMNGKWDGKKCVKNNGNQPSGENKNGNQGQESSDPYATLNSSLEQYGVTDLANLAVKCLEYKKDDCTSDKGCTWNQEKNRCFADSSQVKGLVLDQEATCNNKTKEKCTDKCEWKEIDGQGKCVAKASQTEEDNLRQECAPTCSSMAQKIKEAYDKYIEYDNPKCESVCKDILDKACADEFDGVSAGQGKFIQRTKSYTRKSQTGKLEVMCKGLAREKSLQQQDDDQTPQAADEYPEKNTVSLRADEYTCTNVSPEITGIPDKPYILHSYYSGGGRLTYFCGDGPKNNEDDGCRNNKIEIAYTSANQPFLYKCNTKQSKWERLNDNQLTKCKHKLDWYRNKYVYNQLTFRGYGVLESNNDYCFYENFAELDRQCQDSGGSNLTTNGCQCDTGAVPDGFYKCKCEVTNAKYYPKERKCRCPDGTTERNKTCVADNVVSRQKGR